MTQDFLLLCCPPSKGCTSWQMWTRAPSWSPVTGRQSTLHLQELQVLYSAFVQGLGSGQSQGSGLRIKVEGREFERWERKEAWYRGQRWGLRGPSGSPLWRPGLTFFLEMSYLGNTLETQLSPALACQLLLRLPFLERGLLQTPEKSGLGSSQLCHKGL